MKLKALLFLLFLSGSTLLQAQENDTKINVSPSKDENQIQPPPPPPQNEGEEIFETADEFPLFPGCEEIADETEKNKCSDKKLLAFLAQKAGYPSKAREAGIEGVVYVRFIVEKDGSISHAEVVKEMTNGSGGLAEAALNAVKAMNDLPQKWTPGKQKGEPVSVSIVIPIKFKLWSKEETRSSPKKKSKRN